MRQSSVFQQKGASERFFIWLKNRFSNSPHNSRSSKIVRRFFLIVFITNNAYLFWLIFNISWTPLGAAVWIVEFLAWLHVLFFFFNHSSQKPEYECKTRLKVDVDIFIPAVNEPQVMVRETIEAAININYQTKQIYLLDDSGTGTYKNLADSLGVKYLSRKRRTNAKAGNLNHALKYATGKYVVVLDADQVPTKEILNDCLGLFLDTSVACVTTKQSFKVEKQDFNHDHLFYQAIQLGKNRHGCPVCVGSGAIYSRKALDKIGGFEVWNITEDLTTSYTLNANGYKNIYIDKTYALGTAPTDLPGIYKQRGTWALDTMRLFFRKNPLFKKGLSFRQAWHYFETGYAYIVSGMVLPILFLLPVYALLFNQPLVNVVSPLDYVAVRLPAFVSLMTMYYFLCRGFQNAQYWVGLFPVYFKAIVLAILPWDGKYKVTVKTDQPQQINLKLIIPQLSLVLLYIFTAFWHVYHYGLSVSLYIALMWFAMTTYWLAPIILKGFNSQTLLQELSIKLLTFFRKGSQALSSARAVRARDGE